MARYTWDFNELKNIYDDLQSKLKKETNPEKIEYYKDSIKSYKQLLYINRKTTPTIEEILPEDTDYNYNMFLKKITSFYSRNNSEYIDLLINSYDIIENAYNPILDYNSKICFNNKELIEYILNFLEKMTPQDYYIKNKTIIEKKNKFLNITYSNEYTYQDNVTLFDKDYKKKFVLVTRHNDLLDFIGLPHELSHYILNDYNHDEYAKSNSKFLTEIEGCLINLLFSEYYHKYCKDLFTDTIDEFGNIIDDSLYFKNKFLGDIKEEIESFIIKNEYLMSINDEYKIDEKNFHDRIIDYEIVNIRNPISILSILANNEEETLKYGLSYLVAFDLYDMCLEDPEYAFFNLINIKKDKKVNDLIPYLRHNNITFMDDDYKSLKKYIKNMTN